jgi:hypothetical protein
VEIHRRVSRKISSKATFEKKIKVLEKIRVIF